MSMCRLLCLAVVLILTSRHAACGQSDQSATTEKPDALAEPQVAIRFKILELNDNPTTRKAFAELKGRQTDTDSATGTVRSKNPDVIVQSTELLSSLLDDLCKKSNGKVISESRVLRNSGVQARCQHRENLDFRKKPIKLTQAAGLSEPFEGAGNSPNRRVSSRFVETTVQATGTVGETRSVRLELVAAHSESTEFSPSRTHSTGPQLRILVLLDEDDSLIFGPWQSHRVVVNTEKLPVLGSLPGIGSVFRSKTITPSPIVVLVLVTAEIVEPQVTFAVKME
jgi:hypothetical protein